MSPTNVGIINSAIHHIITILITIFNIMIATNNVVGLEQSVLRYKLQWTIIMISFWKKWWL